MTIMSSYQVAIAAEAFSAGLFAQAGYDVSIQYGANQPEYDLIVAHKDHFLKVSVKGSQDGGWGLNQGFKKKGITYHETVDHWVNAHNSHVVYCLVQFKGVKVGESPRAFLATVEEIAKVLKKARNGYGETTLWEYHVYTRGLGANSVDEIPSSWRFSLERIRELIEEKAIS